MTPTRQKQIAIIKKLQLQGITRACQIAPHLGIGENYTSQILRQENLRRETLRQVISRIAKLYSFNYQTIAGVLGIQPASAHRELRNLNFPIIGKREVGRGFEIPREKLADYRALRKLKMSVKEAGEYLGLKPRDADGTGRSGGRGARAQRVNGKGKGNGPERKTVAVAVTTNPSRNTQAQPPQS